MYVRLKMRFINIVLGFICDWYSFYPNTFDEKQTTRQAQSIEGLLHELDEITDVGALTVGLKEYTRLDFQFKLIVVQFISHWYTINRPSAVRKEQMSRFFAQLNGWRREVQDKFENGDFND